MNAYELADEIEQLIKDDMPTNVMKNWLRKIQSMLIQQAKCIEELESKFDHFESWEEGYQACKNDMNNQEPVAWLYFDDWNKLKLAQTSPPDPYMFPVYTHPHKELSDEEIDIVAEKMADIYNQLRAKESGSRGYAEQCDTMKTIYNAIIKASRGE